VTEATAPARTRAPLLRGADAALALDRAQHILTASLPLITQGTTGPESTLRYGGAALVAEALARAGRGDDATLRPILREALVFAPDRLTLFDGAGGLLVVLDAVDPERTSFASVRARLRDALAASIRDAPPPECPNVSGYDLVSGVAGRALALGPDASSASSLRDYANAYADSVERYLAADDPNVAASVNLGVAHGIPGMLAALNAALPHDRVLGQRFTELVLRCGHVVNDGVYRWGSVWRAHQRPTNRRAWCYQTAGVAAVLDDRGRLDGDDALRALATTALGALLDGPDDDTAGTDAALCHGRGGIAALAWRFADRDARFTAHAERLAHEVLDAFDERLPLGYHGWDTTAKAFVDRPGFIDGALGIAQFFVDAATGIERRWLPLFGLLPD